MSSSQRVLFWRSTVYDPRGSYVVVERVGDVCFYVFNDRKVVSFVIIYFLSIWKMKCHRFREVVE